MRLQARIAEARRGERGAIMVLFPVLMIVLLAVAALLLDMGVARSNRRSAQSIADLSALAAGKDLGTSPGTACQSAVNYFNTNAVGRGAAITPASFCLTAGNSVAATTCSSGSLAQARPSATSGKYRLEVHYPVPDSEIADPNYTTSGGLGLNDGTACQRMSVIVQMTMPTTFGKVLGAAQTTATRSAVVKVGTGSSSQAPSLWLLDPTDCTALNVTSNNAVVKVGLPTIPGLITVDSDSSGCSSNRHTLEVKQGQLSAVPTTGSQPGQITLDALNLGATVCGAQACDPADVAAGRLSPQPASSGGRATRSPVDWRFNCKASYPSFHSVPIAGCPYVAPGSNGVVRYPYVDNLRSAVGASGAPSGSYSRWSTTFGAQGGCNPTGALVAPIGNYWVDCPTGLAIGNGVNVTVLGGNLVLDGGVKMTGGSLTVNSANTSTALPAACVPQTVITPCTSSSSTGAAFIYSRSGDLSVIGGTVVLNNTAVILDNGAIKNTGGGAPVWSAPTEGPFRALSLWAEKSDAYTISGGGSMSLSGVFFTPEAKPFKIAGGAPQSAVVAQFISYDLTIAGSGSLTLAPDSANLVTLPPKSASLIR